jgi:hypothetical protein
MAQVYVDFKMVQFLEENGEMTSQMVKDFSIQVIMKLSNVNLIMDKYLMVESNFLCKMDNILKAIMLIIKETVKVL